MLARGFAIPARARAAPSLACCTARRLVHQPLRPRPVGLQLGPHEGFDAQQELLGIERLTEVLPGARAQRVDPALSSGGSGPMMKMGIPRGT